MKIFVESVLTEDFDPSLPQWLKDAVASRKLNVSGISWDNAEWVSAEPPKSSIALTRYDPTRLPVFYIGATRTNGYYGTELIRDNVVFIPGMNQVPVTVTSNYNRRLGRTTYKNLYATTDPNYPDKAPWRDWAPRIIDFGYLIIADVSTRALQAQRKVSRPDEDLTRFNQKDNRDEFGRSSYNSIDKSGYPITNPSRYANILKQNANNRNAAQLADQLQAHYNDLKAIRSQILSSFNSEDSLDITPNISEQVSSRFKMAVNWYNTALNTLSRNSNQFSFYKLQSTKEYLDLSISTLNKVKAEL